MTPVVERNINDARQNEKSKQHQQMDLGIIFPVSIITIPFKHDFYQWCRTDKIDHEEKNNLH